MKLEYVMEICMFDVRWLKSFNVHYGDAEEENIASLLHDAQNTCFENEGKVPK